MMTPKALFLANTEQAKQWNQIVEAPLFERAAQTALLEYLTRTHAGAVYEAQAAMHRLEGAKALLGLLTNLGIAEVPAPKAKMTSLEHEDFGVPVHLKPASLE